MTKAAPREGIRIQDLARPELTPLQRAAIDAAAAIPVRFEEEAVLEEARRRTGLSDFGAPDFRERLRIWLEALEEDRELGPVGRVGAFRDCVRHAANRLRLEDLLRRHPEIAEVELEPPVIVVGLPRSGTTHLLNLLAADRRFRSLPYWESLEPVPDPAEPRPASGEDPRLARCRRAYEQQVALTPLLRNMHDMAPEHVHEEIEIQALDFSSYELEWIATVPRWRDTYLAHDQTPHYRYLRRALQALSFLRGPRRWVLKSPQHLEQLGPLLAVFPDATVVFTHRDPVAVIASAVTMLAYGDRIRRTRVDPPAVARYWIHRIELLLRAAVRDRDRVPPGRSLDLPFHRFMADEMGAVERIYRLAGIPLPEEVRAGLETYRSAHPRGLHGRILYDLERDFSVDPAALRERFRFYTERFGVEDEG